MPQYMLSVHHDGTEDFDSIPQEEMQQIFAAVDGFNDEVREADTGCSAEAWSRSTPPRSSTGRASRP